MKEWLIASCFSMLSFLAAGQSKRSLAVILPDHAKLQFAGSIGFISAGFGYESRDKKLQADLFYGYVPEKIGGVNIHSITAKLTWMMVSKPLDNNLRLDILSGGILFNYAFGKQYFLFSPENYPYHYYGFPTAAHAAIFIGGGIARNKLGLYYEIGITDRDLVSYVTNSKAISFVDIFNIGVGTRIALHNTKKNKSK